MAILDLQSTPLSWINSVEIGARKEILEAIQRRSIAPLDKKWVATLVKGYVKIAIANGDEDATVAKRRPQIEQAFKTGNCTLETAIALAAAVRFRFQMAYQC